jgi:hypothetical protein
MRKVLYMPINIKSTLCGKSINMAGKYSFEYSFKSSGEVLKKSHKKSHNFGKRHKKTEKY